MVLQILNTLFWMIECEREQDYSIQERAMDN